MGVKVIQNFLEENPAVMRNFQRIIEQSTKVNTAVTDQTSDVLRKRANELYKKKKLKEARQLYTESVKAAEYDSVSESLAYGNRSAVSFELTDYQACLVDVNNSLANTCNPIRLILRKVSCLIRLQLYDRAVQVMDGVSTSTRDDTLRQQDMETYERLKRELADLDLDRLALEARSTENDVQTELDVYNTRHRALPAASSALTVHSSQSQGRFIKVNSDVAAGSVLIRESPYSQVLLPNYWTTHCYCCLQTGRCPAIPVFCRKRSCKVVYCSRDCEIEAWTKYHQYECSHLGIITDTGIGHLAYRIVTQTGYHTLIGHRGSLQDSSTAVKQNPAVSEYSTVYNLVTHEEDVLPEDKHQYTKAAVLLLLCTLNSKFFGDHPSAHLLNDEDVLYIGSLLLRHILQLICNAHAVTVVSVERDSHSAAVMEADQVKLATAIYPTASLLNHSCKPNISVSFVDSMLVVKNSADLKAGDQVYNCYGPHYLKMSRDERVDALKSQYYFDCDCEACQKDSSISQSTVKALRCPSCSGAAVLSSKTTASCSQCLKTYDCTSQLNSVMSAKDILSKAVHASNPSKGLNLARRAYCILKDVVYKHNLDLASAKDMEAKYHAEQGDMKSCADCLRESLTVLERVYKPDAVELAHEYLKLSEVLINSGQCDTALQYAVNSRAIFTKHYSAGHSQVSEVEALIEQIKLIRV